ncbi:MAG: hypothetical protein FWH03_01435 [Firmicutes bacterium]|nr:hypothetical protein [Bacillota bacterium]
MNVKKINKVRLLSIVLAFALFAFACAFVGTSALNADAAALPEEQAVAQAEEGASTRNPTTYLNLLNLKKPNSSTWTVEVYNPHNETLTFMYNQRRAFLNDIAGWKSLSHLRAQQIGPYATVTITITNNGTASAIGVCMLKDGIFMVTRGSNMSGNASSGSMTINYYGFVAH